MTMATRQRQDHPGLVSDRNGLHHHLENRLLMRGHPLLMMVTAMNFTAVLGSGGHGGLHLPRPEGRLWTTKNSPMRMLKIPLD
jgi:hypothetical protein